MAPLPEDRAKALLARQGIAVPRGVVVTDPAEAASAAKQLGFPLVVKALVPVGKKGKAGAVRFVATLPELEAAIAATIGAEVRGYTARAALVEQRATIEKEFFASFSFDGIARGAVLLLSTEGGVEVEEAAIARPDAFARLLLDPMRDPDPAAMEAAWSGLGVAPGLARRLAAACAQADAAFRQHDAAMLEINPLALTAEGELSALGVLMDIDDEALFRQHDFNGVLEYGEGRLGRPPTPLERRLLDFNREPGAGSIRFMELPEGDLVLLLSGGGCSLWSADHVIEGGGRPATYYDATTPSEKLLRALFEGVLTMPRARGLMFGSNIINLARIEARVRILVETIERLGIDLQRFPVVIRMAGPGEELAREAAARLPGIDYFGAEVTLEQALDRFVERTREAAP